MSSSFQSRLREWKIDRRRFLYSTGGLAGLVATSSLQALAQTETPSFSSNPFTLGVASGDPRPDTVPYVITPGAPISTRASFTVLSDVPGLQEG